MNRTHCISSIFLFICLYAGATEYHVSPAGSDAAAGTAQNPLRTINAAAQKAMPGDTVTVHTGVYREWVNPFFGGIDDSRRILYRAAEGEVAQIKGSEPVSNWKKGKDGVWTAVIPNTRFGNFNPFLQLIEGDWLDNHGRNHHTAEVTFRPTCFYPTREGINYITIRGFRISQAATQWGAPTAEQIGMVGAHWSKGWIIEDNVYMDLFYEVDHGPYVCDNNIMLSECSLWDWSESGAYLHNLFGGSIYTKSDDYTGAQRHQVTFAGPFDCDTVNRIVWN